MMLGPTLNIYQFKPDAFQRFEASKDEEWVKELLLEVNEKAVENPPEHYLSDSELNLTLDIKRIEHRPFGTSLLIKGHISCLFYTECVKTLKEMKDSIQIEFKACFIDHSFAEDEEYEDLDESFIDGDIYEIHFSEKNRANLKELIHEQIYLNQNQYPSLLDDDSSDKNHAH